MVLVQAGTMALVDRVQMLLRNAAAVAFEPRRDKRSKCPRCKGSGLLHTRKLWDWGQNTNEPCWFCEGVGVMPIVGVRGFVLARAAPMVKTRECKDQQSRPSIKAQLCLGKFPETRCKFATYKPVQELPVEDFIRTPTWFSGERSKLAKPPDVGKPPPLLSTRRSPRIKHSPSIGTPRVRSSGRDTAVPRVQGPALNSRKQAAGPRTVRLSGTPLFKSDGAASKPARRARNRIREKEQRQAIDRAKRIRSTLPAAPTAAAEAEAEQTTRPDGPWAALPGSSSWFSLQATSRLPWLQPLKSLPSSDFSWMNRVVYGTDRKEPRPGKGLLEELAV